MYFDGFKNPDTDAFDGLPRYPAYEQTVSDNTVLRSKIALFETGQAAIGSAITTYHDVFTELFRASETVRGQQKSNFQGQIDELIRVKNEQIAAAEAGHYGRTAYAIVDFDPPQADVNPDIEDYLLEAIATGRPLHEILPPTIYARRLEHFSSGESSSGHDGAPTEVSSAVGE